MFEFSMSMLQILALILENSPFPCTTAIFLNKVVLEIRTFSNFLNTLADLTPFYCRLLNTEFNFYKDVFDIFHRNTIFHQMVSLDDAILQ